jgi:hypothetical protein
MRHPERVRFAIQVQAGHLAKCDAGVEYLGVGLTGENLNVVAEVGEAATEVANVYALSATVCLAAVGQQSDPHAHARSVMAAPAHAAVKLSRSTLAGCLDTCLDYSLTGYVDATRLGRGWRLG